MDILKFCSSLNGTVFIMLIQEQLEDQEQRAMYMLEGAQIKGSKILTVYIRVSALCKLSHSVPFPLQFFCVGPPTPTISLTFWSQRLSKR